LNGPKDLKILLSSTKATFDGDVNAMHYQDEMKEREIGSEVVKKR